MLQRGNGIGGVEPGPLDLLIEMGTGPSSTRAVLGCPLITLDHEGREKRGLIKKVGVVADGEMGDGARAFETERPRADAADGVGGRAG
jgi:hypothetical protein